MSTQLQCSQMSPFLLLYCLLYANGDGQVFHLSLDGSMMMTSSPRNYSERLTGGDSEEDELPIEQLSFPGSSERRSDAKRKNPTKKAPKHDRARIW